MNTTNYEVDDERAAEIMAQCLMAMQSAMRKGNTFGHRHEHGLEEIRSRETLSEGAIYILQATVKEVEPDEKYVVTLTTGTQRHDSTSSWLTTRMGVCSNKLYQTFWGYLEGIEMDASCIEKCIERLRNRGREEAALQRLRVVREER